MGFVVEGRDWSEGEEEGAVSFSAFVFESNTEGEKVIIQLLSVAGKNVTGAGTWERRILNSTTHVVQKVFIFIYFFIIAWIDNSCSIWQTPVSNSYDSNMNDVVILMLLFLY